MIGKILLHIGKNLSETRCLQTSVVRNSWGFWEVAAVQTQENFAIFTPI